MSDRSRLRRSVRLRRYSILSFWLAIVLLASAPSWARRARIPSALRFEARYGASLLAFTAEREDAALDALAELQREVVRETPRDPFVALERETLAFATKLGRADASALLAIAALHELSYTVYLRESEHRLASLSRQLAESLLQTALAEDPNLRPAVAHRLAELGRRVHAGRQLTAASELYRESVELDPDRDDAWLGLGAIREKRGDYRGAIESLGHLSGQGPAAPEGELRLAVNMLRVGPRPEARQRLLELAEAEDGAPWIRSLAFQELARDRLAGGGVARTLELLDRAVASLPCDTPLLVLRDYARERSDPTLARAPLDLDSLCPDGDLSSRVRYNHPPESTSMGAPGEERGPAAESLAALAAALRKRGYGR